MNLPDKLMSLTDEEKRVRADLAVSGEQLAFLQEVADEAETRMIVSETPLNDREFTEAKGDLERHRRYHQGLLHRLAEIGKERDALLDRMNQGRYT